MGGFDWEDEFENDWKVLVNGVVNYIYEELFDDYVFFFEEF